MEQQRVLQQVITRVEIWPVYNSQHALTVKQKTIEHHGCACVITLDYTVKRYLCLKVHWGAISTMFLRACGKWSCIQSVLDFKGEISYTRIYYNFMMSTGNIYCVKY